MNNKTHPQETVELIRLAKQTNTMPILMFAINTLQNNWNENIKPIRTKEYIMQKFHKELITTGDILNLKLKDTYLQAMDNWKQYKQMINTKNM